MLILKKEGISNLTIEGVASKAGVGKATIYRWWPSRTSLVLEAMENLPELPAPNGESLEEDLRTVLQALAKLLATTPLQGVLAHLGAVQHGATDPEVQRYLDQRMVVTHEIFRRAIERGDLPADSDVEALMYIPTGAIMNRAFYGPPPDDAFIDLVVRTMMVGLAAALKQTRR